MLSSEAAAVISSSAMQLTNAASSLAVTTLSRVTGRVRENSTVLSRSSLEMMSLPHMAAEMETMRTK